MISYLVDLIVLAALLATSLHMGRIYRELKKLRAYHVEYGRVFDQTAVALAAADRAIQTLKYDGSEIAEVLGTRIDEARFLMSRMDVLARLNLAHAETAEAPRQNEISFNSEARAPVTFYRTVSAL